MLRVIIAFVGIIIVGALLFSQFGPEVAENKGTHLSGQTATPLMETGSYSARIALVMGIGDYRNAYVGKYEFDDLRNPVNDAKDMAKVLTNLGFKVILKLNLKTRAAMKKAVLEFRENLPETGAVGLFYFSGHGFQYQNANYLVPTKAVMPTALDIEDEVLRTDYVLRHLEQANRQGVNIVILDACRDSIPTDFFDDRKNKGLFEADFKAGFTNMQAPIGSLIAYATAPNTTSWGGLPNERNSVYTKHLLKALRDKPDVNITRLLMSVRKGVIQETKNAQVQQVPWDSVSLTDPFYFAQPTSITPPPPSPDPFAPGQVFSDRLQNGSSGPEMVVIPAGRFRMGDIQDGGASDEKPVHWVNVDQFAMGKYEVTVGEYLRFVRKTGSHAPEWMETGSDYNIKTGTDDHYKKLGSVLTNENHPIVGISWHDAVAYAEWLSQQTGKQYRLPTEAEWEYAARASTETKYWWGNDIGSNKANCDGCGSRWDNKQTAPVGSFSANPYGLYDTVGNVWEWNADPWHGNYEGAPTDGRVWEGGDESSRVLRGGSWYYNPSNVRTAFRIRDYPDYRYVSYGFRVAARAF